MKIDKEKAESIFGKLVGAYVRKEYPYDQPEAVPPQVKENLPSSLEFGSKEHACFLFAACYWMRGGIKSHTAFRQLTRLYKYDPDMFLPEKIRSYSDLKVSPGLKRSYISNLMTVDFSAFGLGFNAEEISDAWEKNWIKMNKLWGGDPRNILKDVSTYEDAYEEACERIQNKGKSGFIGFQEKMVSMLIYFYMDAGILDRWNFPIPVDFHVLRTIFSHEIAKVEPWETNGNGFYTKKVLDEIRELFKNYCEEHKVDPLILCDAVWLFSGLMCIKHMGNKSVIGKRHGRRTEISEIKSWSKSHTRACENTCGSCIIRDTCELCVPSAVYYRGGKVVQRGQRTGSPQLNFFVSSD